MLAAALPAPLLLRLLPPRMLSSLPGCPIHHLTGLLCPGCGGTRALFALLHGNFAQAWHLNPLLLTLAPPLVLYAAISLGRGTAPAVPAPVTAALLLLTITFTIARNV